MRTVGHHEQELAAVPGAARAARATVESLLADVLDPDALDRALLCTSEVVTNAVEHGRPPVVLRIEHGRTVVRLLVQDASAELPSLSEPRQEAVRGRGIYIVDRCAERWGTTALPGGGKVVWFEFDVDA